MGTPRCARCGIHAYEGDVTIEIKGDRRGWSLCGFCIHIVKNKVEGYIGANLEPEEATNDNASR